MANKAIPDSISGVVLHPKARQRSTALFADLEAAGVVGLSSTASGIDRIRLLADFIFRSLTPSTAKADGGEVRDSVRAALRELTE